MRIICGIFKILIYAVVLAMLGCFAAAAFLPLPAIPDLLGALRTVGADRPPASDTGAGEPEAASEQTGDAASSADGANHAETSDYGDRDIYMTGEQIRELQRTGFPDMLACMEILSKVGSEDLKLIYDRLSDGVTYSELQEMKSVLSASLAQEDLEKLIELLEKNQGSLAQK